MTTEMKTTEKKTETVACPHCQGSGQIPKTKIKVGNYYWIPEKGEIVEVLGWRRGILRLQRLTSYRDYTSPWSWAPHALHPSWLEDAVEIESSMSPEWDEAIDEWRAFALAKGYYR